MLMADSSVFAATGLSRLVRVLLLMTLMLTPIWFNLGDHPFYGQSDARYALVSREMAISGDWLLPTLLGQPHLTKPPLTYWVEAAAMLVLGPSEMAARLPSAMAGSGVLLLTLVLGVRTGGWRRGVLAAGVLAILPLPVVVSRMTMTDSLLAFCWLAVLGCGMVVGTSTRAHGWWLVALYAALAVGLLTKGPVALLPLGIVILWLTLGGHGGAVRKLRVGVGLTLALFPLLLWALAVWRRYPDVTHRWWGETIGRAVGSGDHVRPIWFYLPLFFALFFPATLLLRWPWIDYSWKRVAQVTRAGDARSLWVLATIAPLAFFSLISGKLTTYLLPIAPPLALLVAENLELQILDTDMARQATARWLNWPVALLLVLLGVLAGIVVLAWFYSVRWLVILPGPAAALAAAAAAVVLWVWRQGIGARGRTIALAGLWLVLIGGCTWALAAEDFLQASIGAPGLLAYIKGRTHLDAANLVTTGYTDWTLPYYSNGYLGREDDLERLDSSPGRANLVVISDAHDWRCLVERYPRAACDFVLVGQWPRLPFGRRKYILRLGEKTMTSLTTLPPAACAVTATP